MKKFKPLLCCLFLSLTAVVAGATRIVILSDLHVTPGNANEKILGQAVDEVNAMTDAQLVLVTGDLTNEGSDEQLENVKSILDRIKLPTCYLPGNHENNWSQSATKKFIDLWGSDRFVTELDSLVLIGINCGPYMKMGDGHVKQEDLHWLKSTLEELVTPGKRVVSINHYPLADDLDNYVDYIKVLEKFPVMIHINGHYHKFERYACGDLDCMMVRSLDLGKNQQYGKNGQFYGQYGYTIVDIDSDSIIFYNKRIAMDPEPVESFAVKDALRPFQEQDTVKSIVPEGYQIRQVHCDSASVFTRLAIDDKAVYFGNSLGEAEAVDKATGEQLWKLQVGASLFSRPVVSGKTLVIPTANNKIMFVDKATGRVLSEKESAGPYVADGLNAGGAIYQGGDKKMEKWDLSRGEPTLTWGFEGIGIYCQAAPVIDGDDLIFGAWDTNLYCLDASSGQLKWKWNNGNSANMLGPGNCVPVVNADKVVIVAPDRYMTAIDRKTGEQLWRNNDFQYRESLGSNADNTVAYAKTMDGKLVAVDCTSDDFNLLWSLDMGLGYEHAPCIVLEQDGIVYAGSRRGIITMVDPQKKEVIGQMRLGRSEVNGMDLDPRTGDVYLSMIEGTIYCISKNK